jgi:hypothetical protein
MELPASAAYPTGRVFGNKNMQVSLNSIIFTPAPHSRAHAVEPFLATRLTQATLIAP